VGSVTGIEAGADGVTLYLAASLLLPSESRISAFKLFEFAVS